MISRTLACMLLVLAVSACATQEVERRRQKDALQGEVVRETRCICALPAAERDAEIARVSDDSGIELFCGDP